MGDEKEKGSKNSFIYYHDWAEELLKYPDDLRLKIDDAIKKYVLYGEEPTEREIIFSIFGIIRKQLDRNNEKWDSIKKKRAEAGKKGGLRTQSNFREKKQNQANALFVKQNQANQAVNVNDNVNGNDIINLESNKLDSSSPLSGDSSEPEKIKKSSKRSDIDYIGLANFFNSTLEKENSTIPRIQKITDRRRKYVDARCREYGKEAIMTVIQIAAKSDFLNGKNNKGWKVDFDWLFLPNNFPKVLEGNFNNQINNYGNDSKRYAQSQSGNNGIQLKGKVDFDCGLIED